MKLTSSQQAVIDALEKYGEIGLTMNELALIVNQTKNGIRGRICELRSIGYDIELHEHVEVRKYMIVDKKGGKYEE